MFRKKSVSDELFFHFSAKVQNLAVFQLYLHDSNSIFFGPRELNPRYFRAARCEEARRMNQQKPKNNQKWVRRNPLPDLPGWLEEFTENLVDESVPAHRDAPASSSRESTSEPRVKEVSGKHSIYTHFPKDQNCDICLRTKITRAPCRKRTGTAILRAEKLVT